MTQFKGASRARLFELHAALLEALLDEFSKPEPPSAALLLAARAFLRDNNIVVDARSAADLKANLLALRDLTIPFSKH
jgi:hypothetical protein